MVKVSVVMPVYNGEKYIRNTIKQILEQSLADIELILVDDGSKDGSGAICDQIAEQDKRVRVFHQHNEGICGARNTGIDLAVGEYIAFADQDDDVLSGWLEDNYLVAKEFDADMIKSGRIAETIDENGKVIKRDVRNLERRFYDRRELIENYFLLRDKNVFSPVWDGLFRREIIEKHKLKFRTEFRQGEEDTAFCLEFLIYTNRFVTNSGVYFKHYERYSTSTSSIFNVESLNGLVRSGVIEENVKEKLGIRTWTSDALISSLKQHLIPIMVQLFHRNCNWPLQKRRAYITNLHKCSAFQYQADKKTLKEMWMQDKKKAIILKVFMRERDTALLLISKYYKTILDKKLRATVKK